MTSADLIAAVRSRMGKISDTHQIEDTDITREGDYILKIIAERVSEKVMRTITSVANQRGYSVHANTRRVQKVFKWEGIDPQLLQLGSPEVAAVDRNEYYNFPSLWQIEQILKRKGLPKVKFEWNPAKRTLYIDPAPRIDDETYYYVSIEYANWALSSLPTEFEDILITGTAWRALEIAFLYRSSLGGVQREGGFIDYPADRMKPFIDGKRDEFYEQLRIKTIIYNRG